MKNEPVITVGTITTAVAAILALLTEFGMPLTEGQENAIQGAVGVLAALVIILVTRQNVTPKAQVVAKIEDDKIIAADAAEQTSGTPVKIEPAA